MNIIGAYMPIGAFATLALAINFLSFLAMMAGPSINPGGHNARDGFDLFQYRKTCVTAMVINAVLVLIALILIAVVSNSSSSPIKPSRYMEAGVMLASSTDDTANLLPLIVVTLMGAALIHVGSDLILYALTGGKVRTMSSNNPYVALITYALSVMAMILIEAIAMAGAQ